MRGTSFKAERYEDIGHYLRATREARGIDIAQASEYLRIRERYLLALENGHLSELPGQVYIKGYLQNYSDFLGLDRTHILREFDYVHRQRVEPRFFVPDTTPSAQAPGKRVLIVAVAVAFLCAGLWWLYGRQTPAVLETQDVMMDQFSNLVSTRFRLTNRVYACFQERGADMYPFCMPSTLDPQRVDQLLTPSHSVITLLGDGA